MEDNPIYRQSHKERQKALEALELAKKQNKPCIHLESGVSGEMLIKMRKDEKN